ncbi:MAG: inorganic phosphate transporter [Bacteroidales bacterium]|jgi:phosphate/sulfate permease|nr:inorganic phosphate transporter [Bacteroidales bacterium]
MEYYYLIVVGILFLLAGSDLIVGVANDATNFLSSAIGSKAATFRVVMVVASIGVILGAVFSSGMMEVARNGIFHPQMFYFNEIMLIFLAVMVSDVILLDLFNTYGLPTSTTVSLVFEMLGAAVAISIMKISNSVDYTLLDLGSFLNTSKVLAIVSSILASVVIGFTVGAIIQYLARLLFSFRLHKTQKYFGAIWGGFCVMLISYFIVFKGMKGSSLISANAAEFLQNNVSILMISVFGMTTVILQLLHWFFKFNALRFVVLLGTFALAMAFAGNDLVNFIGVPMAGLNSFQLFQAGGSASPESFLMGGLQGAVPTHEMILLAAGIVMILTLWFSKKAKTVVKTSVDLSRQETGTERFHSTPLSRSIVKMFVGLSEQTSKVTSKNLSKRIDRRFKPSKKADQTAAFDMLRASVNLMVASALIAFGTSLKLPLSTTYITFMVAMGTSLADGAWGRDTAVYRVTGVFTVIGGWFITAIAAFTLALGVGFVLYFGGYIGVIAILALVLFAMWRTQTVYKRREKNVANAEKTFIVEKEDVHKIHQIASDALCTSLQKMETIYSGTIEALNKESIRQLEAVRRDLADIREQTKLMKNHLHTTIHAFNENQIENVHDYVQAVNYLREVSYALKSFVEVSFEHTNNKHKPLIADQQDELVELQKRIHKFFEMVEQDVSTEDYKNIDMHLGYEQEIVQFIESLNKKQMKRVKNGYSGTKNSLLYSALLVNTRNFLLFTTLLLRSHYDFVKKS